ncbi:MAG: PLP-dependent aminotransferase family protein [Betaproteobacteria bacterium]|nr:MAG: PLP-dependent aminotransferase family protein [Betaproteobacteria bacterium]
MKTTFQTEILIPIDRTIDVPPHVQLERQLRNAVRTGRLRAHTPLPSTRSLAADLDLSRGVVVECYEQLAAEGYFTSKAGSGTRVAAIRTQALRPRVAAAAAAQFRYDFVPGTPDVTAFPRGAWLACLRRAFKSASSEAFRYPDPKGPLVTRSALATYLARSRATVAEEDRVIVCNGFAQGIDLVARLLRSRGVQSVAIENPGFGALARRFRDVGIATESIPIDSGGLVVERLRRTKATAVVVTPAHQFPTGAGMTADRRAALLAWSAQRNALIIEDDYDAEYRYDREPLGALQGLSPNRVIYIGTGSKILSPALRFGWLLAPEAFVSELAVLKERADGGSPTIDHLALAEFLNSGEMDRHLRRMRQIYRHRRDVLMNALQEFLPYLQVGGVAAGLHIMVDLPPGMDEKELVRAAREKSIRIFGASHYRARPRKDEPAIVLGYGCATEPLIRQGIQELARLITRSSGAARAKTMEART